MRVNRIPLAVVAAVMVMVPPACQSSEPTPATTSLAGGVYVPSVDAEYVDLCGDRSKPVTESGGLPAWAYDARSIAGTWILSDQSNAVAQVSVNVEGQAQFSVLWLFANPPSQVSDLSVVAISPSGERVKGKNLRSVAPGFLQSVFWTAEGGCWDVATSWDSEEATIRTFVALSASR
jgi:hypothetical protein